MFKLQFLRMPQPDICIIEEMYFRREQSSTITYNFETNQYFLNKGSVLNTNTYFNSFSYAKWKKYTTIRTFDVNLFLKGNFEVSLVQSSLSDGDVINTVVNQQYYNSDTINICTLSYDGSLDQFEGIYYIRLRALSNNAIFSGGYWSTKNEPLNCPKIGVIICTFKRNDFIAKNLLLFKSQFFNNEFSRIKNHLEVFIIDNAGTLNKIMFDHPRLHLIQNRNLGGAGGFTRGIIELLESNQSFTHALLMDDDALINPESIELTYSILCFVKPEHRDLFIGGATLRLDRKYMQLESGAVWNNNLLFNLKTGLDLRNTKDILLNEQEESISYNAWVFSCIPLMKNTLYNLPLPLFMRGDDMEYGIRNSKKLLTMNGICSWHVPVHNRYSFSLNYYVLRNQLILNALYDSNFNARKAIRLLRNRMVRELLYYRYENLNIIYKAFKDFMQGVSFLEQTDGEQLHQEISQMAPKLLNFSELAQNGYPYIKIKHSVTLNERDQRPFSRFIRFLSFNGYLLPNCLSRRGSWENYGIVEFTTARPINFYRRKKVLQVDLISNLGYISQQKKIELVKAFFSFVCLSFRLKHGGYVKAMHSYQTEVSKINNITFWKRYLKM